MAALAIVALFISGCATKPPTATPLPAAAVPEPSSIQALASGFEPGGEARFQKIRFSLKFGSPDALKTWVMKVSGQQGIVYSRGGETGNYPDTLEWDGRDNSGASVGEGRYSASLELNYGKTFSPGKAESKPFVFVTTPPSATFSPNPALFLQSEGDAVKPLQFQVSAKPGLARLAGWTIEIYDQEGVLFKSFRGSDAASRITWDGKGDGGGGISGASSYAAILTVADEYGGKTSYKGSFAMAEKPAAPAATVSTRRAGFSPAGQENGNTFDLLLSIPAKADVSLWKAEIADAAGAPVRRYSGLGTSVPDSISWDGKDSRGNAAAQGSYYMVLSLSYGENYRDSSARSPDFSLVTDPPTGSVTVDPSAPAVGSIGAKTPLRFTIEAASAQARIATWTMGVLDRDGRALTLFQGNWPNNQVEWDGRTVDGGTLSPGVRYEVVAKVADEYGNVGSLKGLIAVDSMKPADEPSSIEALQPGFAPKGDGSRPTISFRIKAGDAKYIAGWKVELRRNGETVVRDFGAKGPKVPSSLSWDGKTSDGSLAAEGSYSARLSLDYGRQFSPIAVDSKPFLLVLSPPTVSVELSEDLLSPDGDGRNETLALGLGGSSKLAKLASWSISILDPGSKQFAAFKGSWPTAPIVWNGRGADGSLVESASDYLVIARLRDEFGNVGEARSKIGTDIFVVKTATGYRISVSSIVFKAFTADFKDLSKDLAERNRKTLDLLASKLAKFPDYRIALEGHAVMINWNDKAKGETEQQKELIPLSKARADAIKAALVERGIADARLETRGLGADGPVVPDSDLQNRWKNRRVDFILLK